MEFKKRERERETSESFEFIFSSHEDPGHGAVWQSTLTTHSSRTIILWKESFQTLCVFLNYLFILFVMNSYGISNNIEFHLSSSGKLSEGCKNINSKTHKSVYDRPLKNKGKSKFLQVEQNMVHLQLLNTPLWDVLQWNCKTARYQNTLP